MFAVNTSLTPSKDFARLHMVLPLSKPNLGFIPGFIAFFTAAFFVYLPNTLIFNITAATLWFTTPLFILTQKNLASHFIILSKRALTPLLLTAAALALTALAFPETTNPHTLSLQSFTYAYLSATLSVLTANHLTKKPLFKPGTYYNNFLLATATIYTTTTLYLSYTTQNTTLLATALATTGYFFYYYFYFIKKSITAVYLVAFLSFIFLLFSIILWVLQSYLVLVTLPLAFGFLTSIFLIRPSDSVNSACTFVSMLSKGFSCFAMFFMLLYSLYFSVNQGVGFLLMYGVFSALMVLILNQFFNIVESSRRKYVPPVIHFTTLGILVLVVLTALSASGTTII